MDGYIRFDDLLGKVTFPMAETCNAYKPGIKKDLLRYIQYKNPDKIKYENGEMLVAEAILDGNFVSEYLTKTENDFSARDCTDSLLKRPGLPPKEFMHPDTITDIFRELFKDKEFIEDVYVKRVQGGKYVPCMNFQNMDKILAYPLVMDRLRLQIKKAEKNHEDTEAYRRYEYEKQAIELMIDRKQDDDNAVVLSEERETKEMVKAVYSLLFTEFDFDSYEKDVYEVGLLADNMDFGKEYQELNDTLYEKNYNFKYYRLNPNPQLIDAVAEKVADKLIKYFEEKRESR